MNYGRVLKNRWPSILVITLLFLLISLVVTLVQPFQYESQVKILVIQKSAGSIDAYSASKSAERIGNNLAQVIYSSSFYSKVINSGFDINASFFPLDESKRRELWSRIVDADVPTGTTILEISTFHPDRDQATVLAQAISYVLLREADEYIGIDDVQLKVVDAPLTSEYPVKPNFLLNVAFGLFLGLLISIIYILITYTEDDEAHEMFRPHDKRQERWERKQRARQIRDEKRLASKLAIEVKKKLRMETKQMRLNEKKRPAQVIEVAKPRIEVKYRDKDIHDDIPEPDVYAAFDSIQSDNNESNKIEQKEQPQVTDEKVESSKPSASKSFKNLPKFEAEGQVKTVLDK